MCISAFLDVLDNSPLAGEELLVMLTLADSVDENGQGLMPSMERLAQRARVSVERVDEILHSFLDQQILGGLLKQGWPITIVLPTESRDEQEPAMDKVHHSPPRRMPLTRIYVGTNRHGDFKIGRAVKPQMRESTLQSEDPGFRILFDYAGTCADEIKLHRMFSKKRKRGEWFVLNSEDLDLIHSYLRARNAEGLV